MNKFGLCCAAAALAARRGACDISVAFPTDRRDTVRAGVIQDDDIAKYFMFKLGQSSTRPLFFHGRPSAMDVITPRADTAVLAIVDVAVAPNGAASWHTRCAQTGSLDCIVQDALGNSSSSDAGKHTQLEPSAWFSPENLKDAESDAVLLEIGESDPCSNAVLVDVAAIREIEKLTQSPPPETTIRKAAVAPLASAHCYRKNKMRKEAEAAAAVIRNELRKLRKNARLSTAVVVVGVSAEEYPPDIAVYSTWEERKTPVEEVHVVRQLNEVPIVRNLQAPVIPEVTSPECFAWNIRVWMSITLLAILFYSVSALFYMEIPRDPLLYTKMTATR